MCLSLGVESRLSEEGEEASERGSTADLERRGRVGRSRSGGSWRAW